MFLTNQPFKRPWEDKGDKVLIKDWHYYKAQTNIWQNPHRSSQKVANFYHYGDSVFKEMHYSDEELIRMQSMEDYEARKQYYHENIQSSQERLSNRKLEREVLQFKSKQKVFTNDDENLDEIQANDPVVCDEMTIKRSTNFKDPSKSINMETASSWHQINHCPTKQLDKFFRPKIVDMDAQGCDRIINKINQDKNMSNLQKEYLSQNREILREKFLQRKAQIEQMQKKCGQYVVKDQEQNNFLNSITQFQQFKNSQIRLNSPHQTTMSDNQDQYQKSVKFNLGQKPQISTQRISYLATPKQDYEPNNIFNHQDFRGLLHADHEEALKNSTAAMKSRASTFTQRFTSAPSYNTLQSSTIKNSNTTKELFPIPDIKTPSQIMFSTMRSDNSQSTMTKEGLSQYIRYGYDAHKPKLPYAMPFNPIATKHGKKLTYIKSAKQLTKYNLESELDQFQMEENEQVDNEMKQLNEVDRICNQSKKRKKNRYPRTALDQALNYHKSFQEHLAQKKQLQQTLADGSGAI